MAHGESAGADGGAGEALDKTNQAAGIASTEVGEDVRDGDAVLPGLLGSVWMKRTTMRSLWTWRKGEGVALGTAAANVGGGRFRVRARENRGGEGARE